MNFIILKQNNFPPIPEKIKLIKNYGREMICDSKGKFLAEGDVILIDGEKDDIAEWLKDLDGFWTSDNPMCGEWKVIHINKNYMIKTEEECEQFLKKFQIHLLEYFNHKINSNVKLDELSVIWELAEAKYTCRVENNRYVISSKINNKEFEVKLIHKQYLLNELKTYLTKIIGDFNIEIDVGFKIITPTAIHCIDRRVRSII